MDGCLWNTLQKYVNAESSTDSSLDRTGGILPFPILYKSGRINKFAKRDGEKFLNCTFELAAVVAVVTS